MREDDERIRTLRTLLELAAANNPNDCWDDTRAIDLLRSRSNADELRALGADEKLIELIFHDR